MQPGPQNHAIATSVMTEPISNDVIRNNSGAEVVPLLLGPYISASASTFPLS